MGGTMKRRSVSNGEFDDLKDHLGARVVGVAIAAPSPLCTSLPYQTAAMVSKTKTRPGETSLHIFRNSAPKLQLNLTLYENEAE